MGPQVYTHSYTHYNSECGRWYRALRHSYTYMYIHTYRYCGEWYGGLRHGIGTYTSPPLLRDIETYMGMVS
jgi:hypothetical protein